MEAAYVEAKRWLEAAGVRVYNATVGGRLEVFQRREYTSFFDSNAGMPSVHETSVTGVVL
jgi:hypothetical protein